MMMRKALNFSRSSLVSVMVWYIIAPTASFSTCQKPNKHTHNACHHHHQNQPVSHCYIIEMKCHPLILSFCHLSFTVILEDIPGWINISLTPFISFLKIHYSLLNYHFTLFTLIKKLTRVLIFCNTKYWQHNRISSFYTMKDIKIHLIPG